MFCGAAVRDIEGRLNDPVQGLLRKLFVAFQERGNDGSKVYSEHLKNRKLIGKPTGSKCLSSNASGILVRIGEGI